MSRLSRIRLATLVSGLLLIATAACASGTDAPAPTSTPTASTSTPALETATPEPTPTPEPPTATPTAIPAEPNLEPTGFPIDPDTRLGRVVGVPGSRRIDWGRGSTALVYSRDTQVLADPVAANSMGWNCRLHVEYEGLAAVDWYIPAGTPIHATMDGRATLYVISLPNAFDHYGIDREPYLGDPVREQAPLSPFPGPGGGKGVYVEVVNDGFVTEYAHFYLEATLAAVPNSAWVDGFTSDYDFAAAFSTMRPFTESTRIASWPVTAVDVIGYSGNSGYSEAPHLHYTVRRAGGSTLCPTREPGFEDGGWLLR